MFLNSFWKEGADTGKGNGISRVESPMTSWVGDSYGGVFLKRRREGLQIFKTLVFPTNTLTGITDVHGH